MRFPLLPTADLDGAPVVVPGDLPPGPRALVLAFEMAQQPEVQRWLGMFTSLGHPELTAWELIVLSDGYRQMEGFIREMMRNGVPDAAQRERTLIAYTDLKALTRTLVLPNLTDCHAFLLDSRGIIYSRAPCSAKTTTFDVFRRALDKLHP